MKPLRVAVLVSMVVLSAAIAEAQFGLYGSPEMLNLSEANPAAIPYAGHATAASYPPGPMVPARRAVRAVPNATVPLPQYASGSFQSAAVGRHVGMPADPAPPEAPGPAPGLSPSPMPAQSPQVVDRMLNGAGGHGDAGYYYGGGAAGGCSACNSPGCRGDCYTEAVYGFEQAARGGCCPWYGSMLALVMGRNAPNTLWTTFESGNDPHQIPLRTRYEWRWGAEIRIGRRFCSCSGTWALEAAYWTLDPLHSFASVRHPNGVSTTLTVGNVFFGGNAATQWFDNALEHRLHRRNEVHSLELNFARHRIFSTAELPWNVNCLLGVRFFRFQERLIFSSLADTANMTDPSMGREAFLDDRIANNLIGLQLGVDGDYYITPSLRVFVAPKFGIYNNHIEHDFRAYLSDGTVAQQFEYPGRTYPVRSTKDLASFMTQIDVGLDWEFAPSWSARVGYRVVAVTGIGLADNQIPQFIVDIPEIANIDANGDLILHGGFAGVTYNF